MPSKITSCYSARGNEALKFITMATRACLPHTPQESSPLQDEDVVIAHKTPISKADGSLKCILSTKCDELSQKLLEISLYTQCVFFFSFAVG